MNHLKEMTPTWRYLLVAKEKHSDLLGHHFHAMMVTNPRLRISVGRNNPFFLRNGTIKTRSLMIKPTRPGQSQKQACLAVQSYCKQEGDFVEEGTLDPSKDVVWEEAMALCLQDSVLSALALLRDRQPRMFILHADSMERSLKRARRMQAPPPPPCRDLASFRHAPTINPNWQVLILAGKTGLGKTQWAKALLPGAPVVRHLDVLAEVDASKGLILDDVGVGHLPFTALLNLLDYEEEGQVHVRYTVASIPPRTRRIFTTNHSTFTDWIYYGRDENKSPVSPEQFEALGRRIVLLPLLSKLFD